MYARKTVSLFLSLLLLVSLTAFSAAEEITVTDMCGREITLPASAERIVILEPSDCEILDALGAADRIIGRGAYCDHPASIANVPVVQSGYDTNVEEIIALGPDLVIMNTMNQDPAGITQLEQAGITVLASQSTDIEGVYMNIRAIGTCLGKSEEAEAVIASMQATFAAVGADKEAFAEKTVYFEVSPLEWGLWTAGADTFMDEIASLLGLTNIFADVSGWAEVSEEQVIARNPDYIVTISMYYGEGPTPVEEILGRPGWENISAVKNGAILNLADNELSRPAPRLADGAKLLFDFVMSVQETDEQMAA